MISLKKLKYKVNSHLLITSLCLLIKKYYRMDIRNIKFLPKKYFFHYYLIDKSCFTY